MDRHVCSVCGAPRPLGKEETFFSALGVSEKFSQDADGLQKRFYQISRALHPDRFGTADPLSRQRSLERMSFLNEAYTTLRDPVALRGYVLTLHGLNSESSARGQNPMIPMELAELWFELQDDLSPENVARFKALLAAEAERLDAAMRASEEKLDGLDSACTEYREGLERLVLESRQRNYLNSMNRDVERLAGK